MESILRISEMEEFNVLFTIPDYLLKLQQALH